MSLDTLLQSANNDGLKFVFVGGKGGVGKTTSSSAIATLLANRCDKRVLLVSTDPAHSLGDAWKQTFSSRPTRVQLTSSPPQGFLEVMEVNPQESMAAALQTWAELSEGFLEEEQEEANVGDSSDKDEASKHDEWSTRIGQFQEWLSGIPGIDEATALSAAISHIESGDYDIIVFDTAPTGHTLKLLALPAILEKGINQLQSWQTTFWGYWEAFKSVSSGGGLTKAQKRTQLKERVTQQLVTYKHDIQKMAMMLQDQNRTRFIVVCIAEFLSISETQRLLQELQKNKVVASHVVVNQLVVENALTEMELSELEALAEVGKMQLPSALLQKTVHACRLTTARKGIQERYLEMLKGFAETKDILKGVCEVPLLAQEVTGPSAIEYFAALMVSRDVSFMPKSVSSTGPTNLYDSLIARRNADPDSLPSEEGKPETLFSLGDTVEITGLAKAAHLNGLPGTISAPYNKDTKRYGVSVQYTSQTEELDLSPHNMIAVAVGARKRKHDDSSSSLQPAATVAQVEPPSPLGGIIDKARAVLEDPEIKAMVASNERYKAAIEECLANPLSVMKYLGDPQMSALISLAMSKL